MKKKLLWLISALPLVFTAIIIRMLPDRIPAHYGFDGEIDRWGSKYEQFIFPAVILVMCLFWHLFLGFYEKRMLSAKDDKERKEAAGNIRVLNIVALATQIFEGIMHVALAMTAWKAASAQAGADSTMVVRFLLVAMGVLFLILGNYMPKVKKNALLGLRTGWSMHNDQTWAASQRYGGKIMMLGGLLMVLVTPFFEINVMVTVFSVIMVAMIVAAIVGSYQAYRKYK